MFLPLIKKLWQRGQTQTQVPASDTIMYSAPFCSFYKYIPDEKYIRLPAGLSTPFKIESVSDEKSPGHTSD